MGLFEPTLTESFSNPSSRFTQCFKTIYLTFKKINKGFQIYVPEV